MAIDLSKLAKPPGWTADPSARYGVRPPTSDPLATLMSGGENAVGGLSRDILGRGARAGLFDPTGSAQIRAAVRRGALRRADARRRRGSVLARLMGLNPMGQRQAMLETERETAGGLSSELGEADLGQLLGGQQFARGLLGQERGYEEQRAAEARAAREARRARGGFGSMLGSLLGTAGGAFLGGAGASLGSRMGRGARVRPAADIFAGAEY